MWFQYKSIQKVIVNLLEKCIIKYSKHTPLLEYGEEFDEPDTYY